MARMKGPDRVRAALDAAALECTIRTLPDSTRTAVEAAAAVGCAVAEIAKTLVFRAGDRAVVAIMSGDNRLAPGKLAAALGEEVGRADADFVRATTGFAIGGVPPLGYATAIDVFMDADLFRFGEVWAAAGSPFSVFPIEPARLRDVSGAKVMDLKVESGAAARDGQRTMLKSVQLGSGLRVSQLCLGTMNFGRPGRGSKGDWTLDTDQARPIFRSAIDNGLFYFDCADAYGLGACETVVGRLLKELLPRDEYVLQTKVAMPIGPGANQGGLSRKHIMEGVDASLRRLGHDYIDVLLIHRHPHGVPGHAAVPIEETLEALHDVVRAGKALYLGGSSMFAWQFAELQLTAQLHGWTRFVAMQNHYNLIYREEEREMNPYCVKTNVALTPWSPLARGVLTGSYRGGLDQGSTARSRGGDRVRTEGLYRGRRDFQIAERVGEVARKYGTSRAQVCIAWLLGKPGIAAPIVGVSRVAQIEDLVAGTSLTLDPEDGDYLEELYEPLVNLLSIGTS